MTSSCFYMGAHGSGYTYYYGDNCSGSTSCVNPSMLCAEGTTVGGSGCWGNGWGVTLNQSVDGADAGATVPTATGLTYDLDALPPGGMQIAVVAPSAPCSAPEGCCAVITTKSGTIPWSDFTAQCWSTTPGPSFDPAAGILQLNFQSNNAVPGAWRYCVLALSY
jgi:hypothetical protein